MVFNHEQREVTHTLGVESLSVLFPIVKELPTRASICHPSCVANGILPDPRWGGFSRHRGHPTRCDAAIPHANAKVTH